MRLLITQMALSFCWLKAIGEGTQTLSGNGCTVSFRKLVYILASFPGFTVLNAAYRVKLGNEGSVYSLDWTTGLTFDLRNG